MPFVVLSALTLALAADPAPGEPTSAPELPPATALPALPEQALPEVVSPLASSARAQSGGFPFRVSVQGDGVATYLVNVDSDSREIGTRDALSLIGRPDLAGRYRTERTLRSLGMIAGWGGGGFASCLFVLQAMNGADLPEYGVAAVALIGGGFAARFAGQRRHLGGWASLDEIEVGVDAHNAAVAASGSAPTSAPSPAVASPGPSPTTREARLTALGLSVDGDGDVRDVTGRRLPVAEFAERLGDFEVVRAHRNARVIDAVTWVPTTVTGGVLLAGGGFYSLVSGFNGTADSDLAAGGTVMALGGIGLATGLVGMVRSHHLHEDTSRWYDTDTMEPKVREQNDQPDPSRPTGLYVTPVIGPGVIGVAGTF